MCTATSPQSSVYKIFQQTDCPSCVIQLMRALAPPFYKRTRASKIRSRKVINVGNNLTLESLAPFFNGKHCVQLLLRSLRSTNEFSRQTSNFLRCSSCVNQLTRRLAPSPFERISESMIVTTTIISVGSNLKFKILAIFSCEEARFYRLLLREVNHHE